MIINSMTHSLRIKQRAKGKYEVTTNKMEQDERKRKEKEKETVFTSFFKKKVTEEAPRPQLPEDTTYLLKPNETMAFHWPNGKRKKKLLRAKIEDGDYAWYVIV